MAKRPVIFDEVRTIFDEKTGVKLGYGQSKSDGLSQNLIKYAISDDEIGSYGPAFHQKMIKNHPLVGLRSRLDLPYDLP